MKKPSKPPVVRDSSMQMLRASQLSGEDGLQMEERPKTSSKTEKLSARPQDSKNGFLSTQFNIMSTIMGVAILGLPYVFKALGILTASILIPITLACHMMICKL